MGFVSANLADFYYVNFMRVKDLENSFNGK